jgi:hypothetical protein|tara:strand:+ start:63 stop:512 length:450 start_codon:yes stop_codon:yes gene_type:complete
MANLITTGDIHSLTGTLGDHFDTFKREIVIFKEPQKVIKTVTSNDSYAGYGASSNPIEFEYVPVSGVYSAIVNYTNNQESELGEELGNIVIGKGVVRIKVEQDARDFILNGVRTEVVNVDGNSFNKITDDKVQDYLGLKYYVFYLEKTD